MKQIAIAVENPNNLKAFNELLDQGFEVYENYAVKNTTIFIMRKYPVGNEARVGLFGTASGTTGTTGVTYQD
jgi:hypothetical protein